METTSSFFSSSAIFLPSHSSFILLTVSILTESSLCLHVYLHSYSHSDAFCINNMFSFYLLALTWSPLSLLHPAVEVHAQTNPKAAGGTLPLLVGAVMTTPTLLLQSQLTVSAFPTPPSSTRRWSQQDTPGTSPRLEEPPFHLG